MAAGSLPDIFAAQFGPLSSRVQAPQAKMQQELDQYLKIITDAFVQTSSRREYRNSVPASGCWGRVSIPDAFTSS